MLKIQIHLIIASGVNLSILLGFPMITASEIAITSENRTFLNFNHQSLKNKRASTLKAHLYHSRMAVIMKKSRGKLGSSVVLKTSRKSFSSLSHTASRM